MKFRQTAALGLSALILGSNILLPYAQATTMVMTGQPDANRQLNQMIDNHLMVALAKQQQLVHPIHKKHNLLSRLNPFTYLIPGKKSKPLQVAKSIPLNPAPAVKNRTPIQSVSATPIQETLKKIEPNKVNAKPAPKNTPPKRVKNIRPIAKIQKETLKATIKPINPSTNINPSIQPAPITKQTMATPTAQASLATASSTAETIKTPTLAGTQSQTYPQTPLASKATPAAPEPKTDTSASAAPKQNPTFTRIYQTYDPNERIVAQKPKAEETFQMLATSPLDKLVLQNRNMVYAPGLDTTTPDMMTGEGGVKVLKSGISQKVTNVDIAIGKAEVLYLSKPVSRVSVSNPDVATAVVISPTQIQLVGKAVGVANLLLWADMVSPDHTVVDISVHRDVSVLINQLKYVDPGIQIVPMAAEDTVILTGQAETRESAQLAIEMAKAFFKGGGAGMAGASPTASGPNSQAPGSALPGQSTNVINLIKVKGEPSTKIELVRQRLHEIDPNIRIDVVPGPDGSEKVILTGRVATSSIASKALNLASVFYGQPGLKLVTAQGGNEFSRMQVSSESSDTGSSSSTSTSAGGDNGAGAGGVNLLQGSVITDATGNVISMLEIAQKPQVRCSIKFLELTKTGLNAMGGALTGVRGETKFTSWSGVHGNAPGKPISTPSSQNAPGAGWGNSSARGTTGNGWTPTGQTFVTIWNEVFQSGVTQVFTIDNRMVAALQALQERRHIRSLAEPTLTMLSGEQASFLAGGEVPIAFLGGNGQISIEFHEYGIRLNLLPNVTDDGKIQMQVAPEVSSIDQSVNIQGVPGFTTRRMNTSLIVEPGQSFVLAGLFKQEDTDSVSRFPGIGSLPIIGTFFRNKWKNRSENELVVLIKPEIIYSQTGQTLPQTGEAPGNTQTQLSKK
jgi:Flp pilus assembly secretin CpaC